MATQCGNQIRVRLHFDYPPPAVVDCRMCWLLVDLNTCRMVADLESIIRDKFELSRQSIINLFIDDCYLLHTESIHVVRDNDSLRVKVDQNGHSHHSNKPSENCKKRQKHKPDHNGENTTCVELMEKKRKKKCKDSLEVDTNKTPSVETNGDHNYKPLKKKKKKAEANGLTATSQQAFSPPQNHKSKKNSKRMKISHKSKSQNTPSDSSCVQDEVSNTAGTKTDSTILAKVSPHSKLPSSPRPAKNCSSSSSSDTDSSDQNNTVDNEHKNDLTNNKLGLNHNSRSKLSNCAQKKHSSESVSQNDQIPMSQKSCDKNSFGENSDLVTLQPMQQQSLSNGAESTPKDYSAMPLLAAPPQAGQKIAFKLLELTENYTPEVSEYKEGMIMSLDPITKQIELELLSATQAPSEPGKFDLVYQNPDGSEIVEYAVSRGSRVTERWDSLLEPRLMI
ncbi:coilin isoform X2 [Syngnathus acus]|uniref:coilin isoform X2 n=1 Tax=Syngnathus acus TaxID=161584 RepID=UPI001885B2E3|nr:coilin isoform X2 [Syngnathus acus]